MLYISYNLKSCTNIRVLLSDGGIHFINGFYNIKKLRFWIHAIVLIIFWKQLHTTPQKAKLVSSQSDYTYQTGRRRNRCTLKYLLPQYNLSSKLWKANIHYAKKEENIKKKHFSLLSGSILHKHSTVECSFPFKNCTYCSSFERKYTFIPLNTKTLKHPIYLNVFKRHRRATTTNIIQEPFAENKAQTNQIKALGLLRYEWRVSFQNELSIKRNYCQSSLLFTQVVIHVSILQTLECLYFQTWHLPYILKSWLLTKIYIKYLTQNHSSFWAGLFFTFL